MTTLYIDADACPVKSEAERVATRLQVPMVLVCNGGLRMPQNPLISLVIVDEGPDAADQWIAARCGAGDVVVTSDLPLADRCIKAGAVIVQPDGEVLNATNIGPRLATRDLMADIRSANPFHQGGGAGFSRADRARFLQSLDRALGAAQRDRAGGPPS
ncbi:MAG: YaiI/YqxD family protein [Paracoccus sp. (in: a-proteobacteria)]|nr:YaiI/YqxD family protein [Paracoccus sp. (in: a-proteobacteria)]